MSKKECLSIFNSMIRGEPLSFQKQLLPLYSDYLTENNFEKSGELISLVVQKPSLIQQVIPKVVEFFRRKYNILSLLEKGNLNNLKTILYYG